VKNRSSQSPVVNGESRERSQRQYNDSKTKKQETAYERLGKS